MLLIFFDNEGGADALPSPGKPGLRPKIFATAIAFASGVAYIISVSVTQRSNQMARNARFWYNIHGSFVKITLCEGESLGYSAHHYTDEGYRIREWQFSYDGRNVYVNFNSVNKDCDGRYERYMDMFCERENLTALDPEPPRDTIKVPAWK